MTDDPKGGAVADESLLARLAKALEEVLGEYGSVTDEQRNAYMPLVQEANVAQEQNVEETPLDDLRPIVRRLADAEAARDDDGCQAAQRALVQWARENAEALR